MGQSVVNAYVLYKKVCERANQNKPMTHLDFQVSVITCWCTTPKIILEPGKATAAVPLTSPPAKGGVRDGKCVPTPASAPAVAGSSDTPAAPLTDEKASQITEKRVNAAKMSYGTSPELHTVCLPIQTGKGNIRCILFKTH